VDERLWLGAICVVGLIWLVGMIASWRASGSTVDKPAAPGKKERVLRPRTPDDCGLCRAEAGPTLGDETAVQSERVVRPWAEVKSRRGRRKRAKTEGYACPNEKCEYYGITDASIHALVGYGRHGKSEAIRDWRCQACGTKMSERRPTAFYRLKTPVWRVKEVMATQAEGLDSSAAERVFGYRDETVRTWMTRSGRHAMGLHQHFFHHLLLDYVELDELRTTLRDKAHEVWVWVALDGRSKIIPVLCLGGRTQAMAHAVIHGLCQCLMPGCIPLFTSDGLDLYFYALTAHFGVWQQGVGERKRRWVVAAGLYYGQVKKLYRRRRLVGVEYRERVGAIADIKAKLHELGVGRFIHTAFVERLNLTMRQGVSSLIRRTWARAESTAELALRLEWWRAYYHFVRHHQALRVALDEPLERGGRRLPQRYRSRTPAMAAGVTHHRWTVQELLLFPLPPGMD
jgi:IS1 family transposase